MVMHEARQCTFHFSFRVDNYSCIVFKVDEDTVLSPPGLSLADDNSRHHCSTQRKLQECARLLAAV